MLCVERERWVHYNFYFALFTTLRFSHVYAMVSDVGEGGKGYSEIEYNDDVDYDDAIAGIANDKRH